MDALSFVHESPFFELATLLALAAAVGFVGLLLRQPLIIAFIAVGMLAGPSALGIVRSHESIELLAELGIAVLLFLVGLKLDLKLIRTLGVVALATGLGQVAFTSIVGFSIRLALGLDAVTTLYVAVALTFSSTIIIVKLHSDKREVDSLHGRIALGFLIVQDLVVVLAPGPRARNPPPSGCSTSHRAREYCRGEPIEVNGDRHVIREHSKGAKCSCFAPAAMKVLWGFRDHPRHTSSQSRLGCLTCLGFMHQVE